MRRRRFACHCRCQEKRNDNGEQLFCAGKLVGWGPEDLMGNPREGVHFFLEGVHFFLLPSFCTLILYHIIQEPLHHREMEAEDAVNAVAPFSADP